MTEPGQLRGSALLPSLSSIYSGYSCGPVVVPSVLVVGIGGVGVGVGFCAFPSKGNTVILSERFVRQPQSKGRRTQRSLGESKS